MTEAALLRRPRLAFEPANYFIGFQEIGPGQSMPELHEIGGTKPPFRSSRDMKHRDIEYTLVQGTGRHIWKWSVVLDGSRSAAGQAMSKAEAVSEAERAIDRGAGPQKDETGPAHN